MTDRSPWGMVLLGVVGGLACAGLLLVPVSFTTPAPPSQGMITAALTVIPAPTATPIPPTQSPPTPTPALDVPAAPGEGVLFVGGYVQISGTGGDGLNLRAGPGLSFDPLYLGLEAEVFKVIEGPVQADGYTWWHLQSPSDAAVDGWGVANYLAPVESP